MFSEGMKCKPQMTTTAKKGVDLHTRPDSQTPKYNNNGRRT